MQNYHHLFQKKIRHSSQSDGHHKKYFLYLFYFNIIVFSCALIWLRLHSPPTKRES